MARYIGPKCRLCRREGVKLFLKGTRCESEKCALARRMSAPGVHGNYSRGKASDFGKQLREKQKVKRIYGVLEKQFKKYYLAAEEKRGVTGEYLLQTLERRFDNVIFRAGLAKSRSHARQLIRQNKFMLGGRVLNIPSALISKGDEITVASEKGVVFENQNTPPQWIGVHKGKNGIKVKILRLVSREDIQENINEQLIVEFYSR